MFRTIKSLGFWLAVGLLIIPTAGTVIIAGIPPQEKKEEPASKVALQEPAKPPPQTPQEDPIWNSLKSQLFSDEVTFREPDTCERLKILHKMILAYNGRPISPVEHLDRGRFRAQIKFDKEHRPIKPDVAKLPTAEELHMWFDRLTEHQKLDIDRAFMNREKYRKVVRETYKDRAENGIPNHLLRTNGILMFINNDDVFISPRDNKPFVFGYTRVDYPRGGMSHDGRIIIWESEGVDGLHPIYFEKQRNRLVLGMNGQCQEWLSPVGHPEFPRD